MAMRSDADPGVIGAASAGVGVAAGPGIWRYCVFTLGDVGRIAAGCGVSQGGGLECGNLGDATRVDGRTIDDVIDIVGECSGIAHVNSSESCRSARIWAPPNVLKGDAGAGLSSASANILAALVALLADEVAGMLM